MTASFREPPACALFFSFEEAFPIDAIRLVDVERNDIGTRRKHCGAKATKSIKNGSDA